MTTKRYAVKSGSSQSIQNTRNAIRNRENFRTSGALAGGKLHNLRMAPSAGRLPRNARERFYLDVNTIDYIVMSYETPIAWHTPAGWIIVAHKFSVTTTAHQSAVYAALNGRIATPGYLYQSDPVPFIELRD